MIPIPTVAAQYNDEMNHVDRGDQIRSYTTYEHQFRRGPWQALLWSFLLEVALANSFILQKKTRHPRWKPYSTLRAWKECICNAIFNTYAAEGGTRKRSRSGKEEDIEDIEARQNHLQRDTHLQRPRYPPDRFLHYAQSFRKSHSAEPSVAPNFPDHHFSMIRPLPAYLHLSDQLDPDLPL
ncbi:hypothetical protein BFJ68_g16379 [Fusarium oxysporum]|uniref:PiggyBac transposable element-derived protein domain-containing protein n=1 Tax=Fusarium oxysporum TaxID=5507 RepID=A0A420NIU2_FUSOX|nr:hypothetical protein BFJ71_g15994 [Fusarium oxysporum]RKK90715.1 hypothetical protein BFJ68_g16379 [Fusarium oxysporum]